MLVIVPREAYGTMLRYRWTNSGGIGRIWTIVKNRLGQFPTDINKSIFSDGGFRPFWATFDKS
ncbi:hypothetical protein GHT06_009947 [Daphnia sinensis]|uniref:Uncharacterized protein n=1 Tax=Daphnia sinensis TaxID=1820382 RepID=A0AAD5L068_9CRUS|nr:hypothetical protein GHT06_009947 [Daphnia sinensis]